MRPSAPQTGSNTVELHMQEALHEELRGLVFDETWELREKVLVLHTVITVTKDTIHSKFSLY